MRPPAFRRKLSEHPSGMPKATFSGHGNRLHLIQWTGQMMRELHLQEAVVAITVDWSTGRLFAARWEPVPAIFRYDLKPVFDQLEAAGAEDE